VRELDRIDDERDLAVLDHVDDVRPPFRDLVDCGRFDAVRREHFLRAARREHLG
jgi:hypothetical protein